ncbi:MAG: heme-copper oxidase subunit III [Candidatus Eremiobacteraeota bacterium]|nr:heme-copper oxidase subunit III [Candidatus Eremiobacteraeota bacterium]
MMFFACWFAAYYELRGRNSVWPPPGVHLDLTESSIGTALLGASSLIVLVAIHAIHRDRPTLARRWLSTAIVCGVLFLAIAVHGWLQNTFGISSHAYGSTFYGITGFHALHVTAGVIALTYLAAGADRPGFRGQDAGGAEAISYYWHFVFIVWLGIWSTIYLVR